MTFDLLNSMRVLKPVGLLPGIEPMRLLLEATNGASSEASAVRSYFSNRRHFRLRNNRALYHNPNTDVRFVFELSATARKLGRPTDPSDEDADEAGELNETTCGGESAQQVQFVLELGHPEPFAIEAAQEISAFVSALAYRIATCDLSDAREYDSELFMRMWRWSNAAAFRQFLFAGNDIKTHRTVPRATVHSAASWNRDIAKLNAAHGSTVFVPKVQLFLSRGAVEIEVGQTFAMPDMVELVVVQRGEFRVLIGANQFTAASCANGTAHHRHACLTEGLYRTLSPKAFSHSEFEYSILKIPFAKVIDESDVESAQLALEEADGTLILPPRDW